MNSDLSSPVQIQVDQSESVDQHKAAVHIAGSEVRGFTSPPSTLHRRYAVIITTIHKPNWPAL